MRSTVFACVLFIVASCGGGSGGNSGLGSDGSVSSAAMPKDARIAGSPDAVVIDALALGIGGSTVAACSEVAVTPCGGDIVGTWNLVGYCPNDLTGEPLIREFGAVNKCVVASEVTVAGSATFAPDGVLRNGEEEYVAMAYDAGCLKRSGRTCDKDIGSDCAMRDGFCICHISLVGKDTYDKYAVNGTRYDTGLVDKKFTGYRDYCIEGDTLTVFTQNDFVGGSGRIFLYRGASAGASNDAGAEAGTDAR